MRQHKFGSEADFFYNRQFLYGGTSAKKNNLSLKGRPDLGVIMEEARQELEEHVVVPGHWRQWPLVSCSMPESQQSTPFVSSSSLSLIIPKTISQ